MRTLIRSPIARRLLKFAAPALALAALAAGCSNAARPGAAQGPADSRLASETQPKAQDVAIDNFSFTPATLTVVAGTTVTWVNRDDVPHTVTADDKAFGSKALDTDDRYSHAFTEPGVYPYFCAVHPHMTGRIIVKKVPASVTFTPWE